MKVTRTICDNCGTIIEDDKPNVIDIRKGSAHRIMRADLCDGCVGTFQFLTNARSVGRRGRKITLAS